LNDGLRVSAAQDGEESDNQLRQLIPPMKTYYNADRSARIFWDTNLRLWTMTSHDLEGNQIGSADYSNNRQRAFTWLSAQ